MTTNDMALQGVINASENFNTSSNNNYNTLESYEHLTTEWDGMDFDLIDGVNVSTSFPVNEPSNFTFDTHIQFPLSPVLKIFPSVSAQYASQATKHNTRAPRQENGAYKDINNHIAEGYRFSTTFELENKLLQFSYLHQLSPLWKFKAYSITPLNDPNTSDVIGAIQYKNNNTVIQAKATNEGQTVGVDFLKRYSNSLSYGGEIARSYQTQQNDISFAVRLSKKIRNNLTVSNTLLSNLSANPRSTRLLLDSTLSLVKNNEFIFSARIKHVLSRNIRNSGVSFAAKWDLAPRFNLPLILNTKWSRTSVGLVADWKTKYGVVSAGLGVTEGIKTYGLSFEIEL